MIPPEKNPQMLFLPSIAIFRFLPFKLSSSWKSFILQSVKVEKEEIPEGMFFEPPVPCRS